MSHTHSAAASPEPSDRTDPGRPAVVTVDPARQLRAVRILVVVLVPIAIWTIAGLIIFWPSDTASHIKQDLSQYTVSGLTIPRGEITKLSPISCDGQQGSTPGEGAAACANADVKLLSGPESGQTVQVSLNQPIFASGVDVGQKVTLYRLPVEGGTAAYQFADFERRAPLVILALVFAVVVIAVARWRGFAALIGLAFAGFILVKFMFPALVTGTNPLLVGLVGASAIMFVVLYAAHGFSARTTTALVGTLFGLLLIGFLGYGSSKWAHLTGVASDDDFVLAATAPDLRLTSVVICGIILAGLGVLNDVTITQASAVWELADADPDLPARTLFSRAMRIGRDHIASTVYTIAFATAGSSLAVLLLIAIYQRPVTQVLQTEMFAAELISILVGSIGLVLAVPLTTAIGVAVVRASARPKASSAPVAADPGPEPEPEPAPEPEPETAVLTRVSPAAEEERTQVRESLTRRFRRRHEDDDFGDFADLHDPDAPPKGPSDDDPPRGRRSRD